MKADKVTVLPSAKPGPTTGHQPSLLPGLPFLLTESPFQASYLVLALGWSDPSWQPQDVPGKGRANGPALKLAGSTHTVPLVATSSPPSHSHDGLFLAGRCGLVHPPASALSEWHTVKPLALSSLWGSPRPVPESPWHHRSMPGYIQAHGERVWGLSIPADHAGVELSLVPA